MGGHAAMSAYALILTLKLAFAFGYAGGLVTCFVVDDPEARSRAAHKIASPCLLATWCSGYALVYLARLPWFELWIVAALALSFGSNGALVHAVAKRRRDGRAFAAAALPLLLVIWLMVEKPTWARILR